MGCGPRHSTRMDDRDPERLPLVVIGGSAGAIEPLRAVLGGLRDDLGAAICVVIHLPEDASSTLPMVLTRAGARTASFAQEGEPLVADRIYVAPPGFHMLVEGRRLRLSRGARENRSRPAIDPLFRTAARALGPSVMSVVLSGTLDDGAAGTAFVRARGGTTIAQDPGDALFGDMPRNAILTGVVDHVLPAARIPALIEQLVDRVRADPEIAARPRDELGRPLRDVEERGLPEDGDLNGAVDTVERAMRGPATDLEGVGSAYSCPDCGGVLFERGKEPGQFLCRTGHRYSPDTLEGAQEGVIEDALWVALRALEDQASLALRVRDRSAARGDRWMERRFDERRLAARGRADKIRRLLQLGATTQTGDSPSSEDVESALPA